MTPSDLDRLRYLSLRELDRLEFRQHVKGVAGWMAVVLCAATFVWMMLNI